MESVPRLLAVEPVGETELLVRFDNGVEKLYDCRQVSARPASTCSTLPAFFAVLKVDPGGYGISWNDQSFGLTSTNSQVNSTPSPRSLFSRSWPFDVFARCWEVSSCPGRALPSAATGFDTIL